MSVKPLRAAVPKNLLSYLNSFEHDRNHYIPDPTDERRIAVANQKIFIASGSRLTEKPLNIGDKIIVLPADTDCKTGQREIAKLAEEFVIVGQSFWNPDHILVEGKSILSKENVEKDWKTPSEDLLLTTIATNCVTTTSSDGTQAHDPTRTSDGSSRKTPAGLVDDGENKARSSTPLTEYWLGKARDHNKNHEKAPVVAILDTGIDFQFDWTMRTLLAPSCPLWFNEGLATENKYKVAPLQKRPHWMEFCRYG